MKQQFWQHGLIAAASLTLAACGGGDGGGQSASTAAAPSMATALSVKNTAPGQIEPAEGTKTNTYIVRMADEPATAYKGGVAGFAATKPNKGQKIDPDSSPVAGYKGYLASRHDAVLASVGGGNKLYSYGSLFQFRYEPGAA